MEKSAAKNVKRNPDQDPNHVLMRMTILTTMIVIYSKKTWELTFQRNVNVSEWNLVRTLLIKVDLMLNITNRMKFQTLTKEERNLEMNLMAL